MRRWPPHSTITDKLGSYPKVIHRLQREGKLSGDTKHRTSKYLNDILEADHGGIKRVLRPTRGLQTIKTAYATIKGFEVMCMIRRRQCILCQPRVAGEVQFVNTVFGLAA
jgi:transposase, IS6 family